MWRARRQFMGELAAWHLAGVVAKLPFTAELLKVEEINPYRAPAPPSPAMARLLKWREERRWKAQFGKKKKEK